jgi:hypothetical protein
VVTVRLALLAAAVFCFAMAGRAWIITAAPAYASGLTPAPVPNTIPVYAGVLAPATNATNTPVVVAVFRSRLAGQFPRGLVLSVYADAGGTATGQASLVNATTGNVLTTATISTGAATIYESAAAQPAGGEFDWIIRFRVSAGAGTVALYYAVLREP